MRLIAAALLVLLAGCPGPIQPAPPGAIRCSADTDCPGYPDRQHCGYEGVDRPFICLDGPPDDAMGMPRPDGG